MLHVIFAADRSSIKRDCLSKRNRNRGKDDCHRHSIDYVGNSVIGGEDQSESDVKSESTCKNIMKESVTGRGGLVKDNAEGCVSDNSTYSIDKCKNGHVQRCGNCVEKVQTVRGIDGEVEEEENGVGLHKEGEGVKEGVKQGEMEGEGADDEEERENDDIFMQALVSITRLSDDEYEFRGTSDNQWIARTKEKATNKQRTPKKQKKDNEVGAATAAIGGECAVSIRYKEARFIIGPPRYTIHKFIMCGLSHRYPLHGF